MKLSQMKTNQTHFFQTLNTQMKKALIIKKKKKKKYLKGPEPNRQDEKVSAESTETLICSHRSVSR